ncbi:D,D-heptose 1,7-bisphosphate phosphatase [bacterium]|nr:MAG: D,D-heptose 1,7-bisphosphate phosphatase [bacterium]
MEYLCENSLNSDNSILSQGTELDDSAITPAVFMDRDGTIIQDVGFIDNTDRIILIPGAIESIRILNNEGFAVVIVTNQSGVARGYFDEETVIAINQKVDKIFRENGARIDAFYYCPHYPNVDEAQITPKINTNNSLEKYWIECECRKPKIGMVEKAVNELSVIPKLMIGDRESDILLAKNMGVPGILVLTGEGNNQSELVRAEADFVATDIKHAVQWFLQSMNSADKKFPIPK